MVRSLNHIVRLFLMWSVGQFIMVNSQPTLEEDSSSTTCHTDIDSEALGKLKLLQMSFTIQNEKLEQLQTQVQKLETKVDLHSNKSQDQQDLLKLFQSQHQPLPSARLLKDQCIPLMIQQHFGGFNYFNRSWAEFKVGFGSKNGNYWIGNELLHQLTKDNDYKLRFDLQARNNSQWYWAEYSAFTVGDESTGYQLQVGGFNGTVYGDALRYQNGMKFTTVDRDNDRMSGNCAEMRVGGFWYKDCGHCNVNGQLSADSDRGFR